MIATGARRGHWAARTWLKVTVSAITAGLFTVVATPIPRAAVALTARPAAEEPAGNNVGGSVAVSGSTVLIGASGVNGFRGAAYVDVNTRNGWRRQATLSGTASFAGFGFSVAVQSTAADTFAIVGAIGSPGSQNNGTAYVYTRSGRKWHRTATLTDPHADRNEAFGWSMATTTTTAVISAYDANGVTGAVCIFGRSGNTWHFEATLTPPAPAPLGDAFGWSEAILGQTVVIGALGPTTSPGAAYIYARSGDTWRLEATLADPGHRASDLFGTGVAVANSTVAVGAAGAHGNRGAVYLFRHVGQRWLLSGSLTEPAARSGDWFGTAVAMSGLRLLIGASRKGQKRCGAAYDYGLARNKWRFRTQVINPGCANGDDFGDKLALSGRTAVIGAPGKARNTGAAYVVTVP